MRRPPRRATQLAALVAASALWALSFGGPALAHAGLEGASPEDDETVPRPPQEVRLTFNEPVRAEFEPVEVYAPGGERADTGDAGVDPDDPAVVAVALKDGLPAGDYRVEWRVTSADGDPIDGEYRFTAQEAGEAAPPRQADGQAAGASGPGAGPLAPLIGGAVVVALAAGAAVYTRRR
ncbi:hypothetical protein GBA63_21800 (plasmid) [Rubrobacter tropicus]|uniref:CopC domain-containing protein n=1 Tax=Rubrobacter tropicus TaxID=2653851 RepID=A0A6G8QFY1_9ACTN|nr:copper resistance CopC family protein [Rubrobacter tropicus]QIN85353.1 hypothetical protein GBA63_21800 [Rubrobacter tropicus]